MADRYAHCGDTVMKNNTFFARVTSRADAIEVARLLNRAEDEPKLSERSAADVMADHLEQEAVKGIGITHDTVLTASIAISLKRIADAVAPVNGQDIGTTLFYMEQRLGPQS